MKRIPLLKTFTLIFFIWLASPFLTAVIALKLIDEKSIEVMGQIGDTFGAINALFSGFAFAAVVITLHLQKKDLEMQKEELALTREELKRSANVQEEHLKIVKASHDGHKLSIKPTLTDAIDINDSNTADHIITIFVTDREQPPKCRELNILSTSRSLNLSGPTNHNGFKTWTIRTNIPPMTDFYFSIEYKDNEGNPYAANYNFDASQRSIKTAPLDDSIKLMEKVAGEIDLKTLPSSE